MQDLLSLIIEILHIGELTWVNPSILDGKIKPLRVNPTSNFLSHLLASQLQPLILGKELINCFKQNPFLIDKGRVNLVKPGKSFKNLFI